MGAAPAWMLPAAPASQAAGNGDRWRKMACLHEQAEAAKGGALKALVAILARWALGGAAELGELRVVVVVPFLAPSEAPVIIAAAAAAKAYHEEAKCRKSEHNDAPMGPPFARVWMAMIRAVGHSAECPEAAEGSLGNSWADFIMNSEIETVANSVRACRVRPTRKQDGKQSMHRVAFAVGSSRGHLGAALTSYFIMVKDVRKHGAAPKGALERDAQKLLDKLEGNN
ncbi:unnamed protein product [Prorocentrum cordatum]|uniref:Uncharacterized protein n=1 Tax=Prorocentrum cordatum TaxID=2364126 RepID=A0ABN9W998_9DINO|nr:unnamed protein product [Polarella glacialis]